jgi:hypothetical protein
MSGAVSVSRRQYRVRVALPYSETVGDTTVDFVIAVGDPAEESRLVKAPVVRGQTVHPIRGRSDMQPWIIEGIDTEGSGGTGTLTADLSNNERWRIIGRLCDVQYQDVDADGTALDDWMTYGTGRCTQLDELDGPGKLRLEISDESWKVRTGRIFETADTTQLWPAGVRSYWRGFEAAATATGFRSNLTATTFFFEITGAAFDPTGGSTEYQGAYINGGLRQWIRNDLLPEAERTNVVEATHGNFRHLRLSYNGVDYEVITFSASQTGPVLEAIDNPTEFEAGGVQAVNIWGWAYIGSNPAPPGTTLQAYLWAPTAPPSSEYPLHLGVADSGHFWGTDLGFIHVADLTRRVFDALGLVYDPDNLDAFEADKSFPALSPRVNELPDNPMEWMQRNIWAFCGVTTGRDVLGRLKLIDLRPPREVADYTTVLDASNARNHRWRLVGAEMVNSIQWKFLRLTRPKMPAFSLRDIILRGGADDEILPELTLDNFLLSEDTEDPEDGDTTADSGRRVHVMDARAAAHVAFDTTGNLGTVLGRVLVNARILASGAGALIEPYRAFMTPALLNTYQDGLLRGHIEIHGDIADGLEEGDVLWLDLDSLKIPSPGRLGGSLPASVGPQNPGSGQGTLEAGPIISSTVLQDNLTIIVTLSSVPIGQTAVVEYVATSDPSDPPPSDSQLWLVGGTRTSAGSVTLPAQPRDSFVWVRVSGYESDIRVSTYSTPEVVEVPEEPAFVGYALTHVGSGSFVVTWSVNTMTLGVLVQWAEHEPGTEPDTYEYDSVDAADGTLTIPETVAVGNFLTVILTAFAGFSGGSVDSPPGQEVVLSAKREEAIADLLDHALGGHTDTDFDTPADGDVVQWDETLGKYIVAPVTAEAAAHNLDSHSDVTIAAVADGHVLTYDSGTSQWVNEAPSAGGTLDGLSDVVIDSPEQEAALIYDSGLWVPRRQFLSSDVARVSSSLTVNSTSWMTPNTDLTCAVVAQPGDIVAVMFDAQVSSGGTATALRQDFVSLDESGNPSSSWASDGDIAAAGAGILSMSTAASTGLNVSAMVPKIVTDADVVDGVCTVRHRSRIDSAGSRTITGLATSHIIMGVVNLTRLTVL